MKDKELIRKEIERWMGLCPECGHVLGKLCDFIDSIQEESNDDWKYSIAEKLGVSKDEFDKMKPVSEPIDFEQELYKAFGQVKDFTFGMQIAKRFYEIGIQHQEPVSEDFEKIVEEIAEPTILNAYGIKELARRLRNTICGTSVSEDLGEYINELSKQFPEVSFAKLSRIAVRVAKWQKEQLMAKAFDFTKEHNTACVLASECLRVHGWFNRERDFNDLFRHLSCVDELFEGKFRGKTKVIVIKED